MKKIAVFLIAGLALAGCSSSSTTDRALVGGGLGAATGAVVGAAAAGTAGGALAGAAIGGAGGALIGAGTAPKDCVAYDAAGRPFAVRCP